MLSTPNSITNIIIFLFILNSSEIFEGYLNNLWYDRIKVYPLDHTKNYVKNSAYLCLSVRKLRRVLYISICFT